MTNDVRKSTELSFSWIQWINFKNFRIISMKLSGYHADTPITIKAEAIPQGRQLLSLIFMSTLYNVS